MEKNVGLQDRFFRGGIGFLSLAIAYVIESDLLQVVFGGVALFGLGTALVGFCPLSKALGMDTTRGRDDRR